MRIGSCFAGIGGFDLAFQRCGARTAWTVEIDRHCDRLLGDKFPEAKRHSDITSVDPSDLEDVDVICGGSPCQDFSVAGQRVGIEGKRSGLVLDFMRIIGETRKTSDGKYPTFALLENVPGMLSSNGGRDFAMVLRELAVIGALDIGWAVLDAQWFGLAQRRKRVFIVADFRGRRCAEILSLESGLRWHPAPSRKAREDIAGTLGGSSQGGGFRTTDIDGTGAFIAPTINSHDGLNDFHTSGGLAVAHTLRGEGFDASEDGTGMGTPLVLDASRLMGLNNSHVDAVETNPIETLRFLRQEIGEEALSEWGLGVLGQFYPPEVLRTALHGSRIRPATFPGNWLVHVSSSRTEDRQKGAMLTLRETKCAGRASSGLELPQQLTRELGAYLSKLSLPRASREKIMLHLWEASEGIGLLREALSKIQEIWRSISIQAQPTQSSSAVRRLVPEECEFLQGYPRGWTAGFSDSTRYRMLGNSVAVPVVEWIARRMMK